MNLKEPDNRSKCMYSRITYVINILFDISPWYQRLDLVCVLDTICHLIKLSKYLLLCFSSSFPIKFANCYPVFKCISLRACPETLDCLHLISLIHLVFVLVLKNGLISFFFVCLRYSLQLPHKSQMLTGHVSQAYNNIRLCISFNSFLTREKIGERGGEGEVGIRRQKGGNYHS